MIARSGASPAPPSPLPATAATMPATWVPCPRSSPTFPSVLHVGAVDVVDVAVAVVVDAVGRDLAGVRPEVRREVGVVELGAAVEHRDEDAVAERLRPRDRGADAAGPRADRPLLAQERVSSGLRSRRARQRQRERGGQARRGADHR